MCIRDSFIYNYTSVEYFPMSVPPVEVYISEKSHAVYVSDSAGNVYELIRPAPWRGGLKLRFYTEGGYTARIEDSEHGTLFLVRASGKEQAATLGAETALFLLKPSGLKRLEFKNLEGRAVNDIASFKDLVILAGEAGERGSETAPLFLMKSLEEFEPLSAPPGSYRIVRWSPVVPIAVIAGTSILVYEAEAGVLEALEEVPKTEYEAVAFSSSGSYVLIGGRGALLIYDGEVHEVAQRFVVNYHYIQCKPGSDTEFLASTSLGLMELRKHGGNPGFRVVASNPVAEPVESGLVKVTYLLRATGSAKVSSVEVKCNPECVLEDRQGLTEFKPLAPARLTLFLRFEEGEKTPEYMKAMAFPKIAIVSGEVFELPPAKLVVYFEREPSIFEQLLPVLPMIGLAALGAVILSKLRGRARRRPRRPRREEAEEAEAEREERRGGRDELGDVIWD